MKKFLFFLLFPSLCLAQIHSIQLTGEQIYSGQSDATNSWLYLVSQVVGTATPGIDGYISPIHIDIGNDQVDTGGKWLSAMSIQEVPNTGYTGGRSAIYASLVTHGSPSGGPYLDGNAAAVFVHHAQVNMGGSDSNNYLNMMGSVFGSNSNVWTDPTATYLLQIVGQETDVSLSGSAGDKFGISIVQGPSDTTRGTFDDAAISLGNSDASSTTWKYGIEVGSYAHKYPLGEDSTILKATGRKIGGDSKAVAKSGIDFTEVTFTGPAIDLPSGSCIVWHRLDGTISKRICG